MSITWKQKFPERAAESDFRYNNTERGFIVYKIGEIFKPSQYSPRKHRMRKRYWIPETTKKEVWEALIIHVEFMKDLYPNSNGRLCRYCHQPWTYQTLKKNRGKGRQRSRGPSIPTNFCIDRFHNDVTYQTNNIIFCCSACNDRKRDSLPEDWKNFLRVEKERNEKT